MNAAIVSRTLSVIPERVIRAQTGSLFDPQSPGACPHPERVAHLAQFLGWLAPLKEVTKDDLRIFGLLTPYGKPAIESPLEDEAETDVELDAEFEEPAMVEARPQPLVSSEIAREPALT